MKHLRSRTLLSRPFGQARFRLSMSKQMRSHRNPLRPPRIHSLYDDVLTTLTISMPFTNPQLLTLRLYAEFISRHESLAGTLTLAHGQRCSSTGLPAAVSIAGGTSLLIDPDTTTVKSVFRTGGLDFIVNTLDEALRVLKNEIRKHTPLSVALTADPTSVLAEMRDRGVEPNLEVSFGEPSATGSLALTHLQLPTDRLTPHAASWLAAQNWFETWLPTATTADLRTLDTQLLAQITDAPRRQWLSRIPNYQRTDPNSGRAIWLTTAELDRAQTS
jgi:hypothetical protein